MRINSYGTFNMIIFPAMTIIAQDKMQCDKKSWKNYKKIYYFVALLTPNGLHLFHT